MKIISLLWIATAIMLFAITSYADEATNALNDLLAQTATMRADFTQTITDKTANNIQSATGRMALKRPGQFRWEVLKPIAQTVVANGQRLWIYDPDLEQVTIRFISKEMGETPALLLSNTETTLANNFIVRDARDPSTGAQWFVLTPKNQNSMLAAIKLGFVNHQIDTMYLEDHLGHTTVIKFSHVIVNTPLSSSLFTFKAPPHVDVIDETQQER